MNLDKLNKLVSSIKNATSDNEKYSTSLLFSKIASTAAANPNDMTLRMMSNVLEKMANDGRIFIQRSQLKDLYKQFYTRNTLADDILSEELSLSDNTIKNSYASKSFDIQKKSSNALSNVYEGILDKDFAPVFFEQSQADMAVNLVKEYLEGQNLSAKVEVVNGNPDTILTIASVQTPKGFTNFYVPVEFKGDLALTPNRFITHYGSADFKFASAYVLQHSGEQVKIAADVVYSSLLKKEAKEISKVDLALAKHKMTQIKEAQSAELQEVMDKAPKSKHKYQSYIPVDTVAFSKKLATASGTAELEFGSALVSHAASLVQETIKNMGLKSTNIEVAGTEKNNIKFAVKVANASFFVPVKVENNKVFQPQVLINNGNVASFSKATVFGLVRNSHSDSRALTAIASNSTLSAHDLMKEFKESLATNNIDRAEEVLSYLQVKNASVYKEAISLFMNSLSGNTKVADGCTSFYVGKNSIYPVCNHTGLTMNKVAQGSDGKCYALTSKK